MNKKLIAVAVAGVVAAPAAYADISMYGRLNNGIQFTENAAGDNTQDMGGFGSRFGIKGAGDIGNGMSAFAHYEFSTTTDKAGSGSGIGRRLSYVGLSGPFGSVSLGQQWSAYWKAIGTNGSLNYWNGPHLLNANGIRSPRREGNTIQYANSFGPASLLLDARVDDGGDGSHNGNGFGGSLTITPMDNVLLAAGVDSDDSTGVDVVGFVGNVKFGGLSLTLGHEQGETEANAESNNTLLFLGTSLGGVNLTVGYARVDNTAADGTETDDSNFMIGGHYMIGGGLRVWGEFVQTESAGVEGADTFLLGVRMDF